MVRRSLIAAALIAVVAPLAAQEDWVWTSDRPDGKAPLGIVDARTMEASEVEFTYRFSQMNSLGIWNRSDSLGITNTVLHYTDAPMTHTDQGHSVSFSYGVSDNLTLIAKGSFHTIQREALDTRMNAIVRVNARAFGDTELGAIYNVYRAGPYRLDMQAGATIPTGETLTFDTVAGVSEALPYDMRPGTGAFGVVAGIGGGVQNEAASIGGQFKMWTPVLKNGGTFQRGRTFEGNGWVP